MRCTAATTDDFTYAEGETVVSENKDDEVCNITLDVHENPMSVNHLIYATVKDTVQQVNIAPPKCNCRLAVNRNAERKRIVDDMERNKNGVCRNLMELNDASSDNFRIRTSTGDYKTGSEVWILNRALQRNQKQMYMIMIKKRDVVEL